MFAAEVAGAPVSFGVVSLTSVESAVSAGTTGGGTGGSGHANGSISVVSTAACTTGFVVRAGGALAGAVVSPAGLAVLILERSGEGVAASVTGRAANGGADAGSVAVVGFTGRAIARALPASFVLPTDWSASGLAVVSAVEPVFVGVPGDGVGRSRWVGRGANLEQSPSDSPPDTADRRRSFDTTTASTAAPRLTASRRPSPAFVLPFSAISATGSRGRLARHIHK